MYLWLVFNALFAVTSNTVAKYIDESESCRRFKQNGILPVIKYFADPYPLVTKDTNVSLSCTAIIVKEKNPNEENDPDLLETIHFYRNNAAPGFHNCDWRGKMATNGTCHVTVTDVKQNDTFKCVIHGTFNLCNAASIMFDVRVTTAAALHSLWPIVKFVGEEEVKIVCISSGLPKPIVYWLVNGSFVSKSKTMFPVIGTATQQEKVKNGSNVYYVTSTISIIYRQNPIRVQCFANNSAGEVRSNNASLLDMKVEDLTPTIWKASWSNVFFDDRHDNVTTYNASISCSKEFSQDIMVINDQSATFTLTNPFLGKCQIKVSSLNDNGDAAFGQIAFISERFPPPENVMISNITESSVVLRWTPINKQQWKHNVNGYKVILKSKIEIVDYRLASNSSELMLSKLQHATGYNVSVTGIGDIFEGKQSEWIYFKTNDMIAKKRNKLSTTESNDFKSFIVIIPSCAVVVAFLITFCVLLKYFRKHKHGLSKENTPDEMENARRASQDNLRILFPEYFGDEATEAEDISRWEIEANQLAIFDHVLGGGQFGVVKEGLLLSKDGPNANNNDIPVAIKTLRANRGQSDWFDLMREFEILQHLNITGHENVVKLYGACAQEVPIMLVMEYCKNGNLKDFLINSQMYPDSDESYTNIYSKLTERQLLTFAVEICKGMIYLDEQKVVHRDIASRNILLTEKLVPKISDFGLARKLDVTRHYIVNKNKMLPVKWMSIESLLYGRFTSESERWSYGILLWEICTQAQEPYSDLSPYHIVDYLVEGNRMACPPHCNQEIYSLMSDCWSHDPENRPSFSEIYRSLNEMLTCNEKCYINIEIFHDTNEPMTSESRSPSGDLTTSLADSAIVINDNTIGSNSESNVIFDTAV
ncbi:angiopoietin-1 receptor-like isoform X2 [Xenia sp. Carnegie-2017]|nr:angiopoietin-1 receptor-like isoform X2 [Xenia sp. Carnegie-2017]